MSQIVMDEEFAPGTRIEMHSDIARRIVVTCLAGGTAVEFVVLAGQSFRLTAGRSGVHVDTFDVDGAQASGGVHLVPGTGAD